MAVLLIGVKMQINSVTCFQLCQSKPYNQICIRHNLLRSQMGVSKEICINVPACLGEGLNTEARIQRPQHNGEEQNQSLARARTAEQEQVPNRSPDQFQRRLLVFSKFK